VNQDFAADKGAIGGIFSGLAFGLIGISAGGRIAPNEAIESSRVTDLRHFHAHTVELLAHNLPFPVSDSEDLLFQRKVGDPLLEGAFFGDRINGRLTWPKLFLDGAAEFIALALGSLSAVSGLANRARGAGFLSGWRIIISRQIVSTAFVRREIVIGFWCGIEIIVFRRQVVIVHKSGVAHGHLQTVTPSVREAGYAGPGEGLENGREM